MNYADYLRTGILLACSLRMVGIVQVDHQLLDGALERVCRGSSSDLPNLRWLRQFLHFGENSIRVVCHELQDVLSAACFAEVACFDGSSYNYFKPTTSVELATKLLQHCDTTPEDALTFGQMLSRELDRQLGIREEFGMAATRPYGEVTRPEKSPPSRLRDLLPESARSRPPFRAALPAGEQLLPPLLLPAADPSSATSA